MNLNTTLEDDTAQQLKILCSVSNKKIKEIIDEIILLGIEQYKKKYGGK